MKNLKKKRRIQVFAIATVALLVSVSLIGYAFRDGINLYRDPSEVLAEPPSEREFFQLGGLVAEDSIGPVNGVQFSFVITDTVASIPVNYVGKDPAPDLFSEGQGTIAKGRYRDGVFYAETILAKHDETYMPKEVIDTLKERGVYEESES
ncbi:cytochrome c maturation protein CcmE [Celeribacter naphthalenivorans]|uniref:cytochrome c maturation protein CcmE n=1 Tax=Celeribacter naphthalenivorans TaxID=1614694 RepID=UPI001CF97A48|nr:cytochrome c maturation protein CcmE [Celeribacter naphthalenivorans]